MTHPPPIRRLEQLCWPQILEQAARPGSTVIWPFGAIEQHGPHLPVGTDALFAERVCEAVLARLDPALPIWRLPLQSFGFSPEHRGFPGTLSLRSELVIALVRQVGRDLAAAGVQRLVLLNAHGGQPQVLEIAARDLHQIHGDFMVFPLFVWAVPNCAGDLLTPKELELGIHAGDAETSLMLSMLPDQVRQDRAQAEFPQDLPTDSWLTMEGALPFAWTTRDLSASGVLGDPTVATAAKGEQLLQSLAQGWVRALEDIYRFRQPQATLAGGQRDGLEGERV